MKAYKSFDFFVQAILIVLMIIAFILGNENFSPFLMIVAFGFVQAISIIIHLIAGPQKWKKVLLRKIHLTGTIIVLLAIGYAFYLDNNRGSSDKYAFPGLDILIYATIPAILLSIFYFIITEEEWRESKE